MLWLAVPLLVWTCTVEYRMREKLNLPIGSGAIFSITATPADKRPAISLYHHSGTQSHPPSLVINLQISGVASTSKSICTSTSISFVINADGSIAHLRENWDTSVAGQADSELQNIHSTNPEQTEVARGNTESSIGASFQQNFSPAADTNWNDPSIETTDRPFPSDSTPEGGLNLLRRAIEAIEHQVRSDPNSANINNSWSTDLNSERQTENHPSSTDWNLHSHTMGNLCSRSSNPPDNFSAPGRTLGSSAPPPSKPTSNLPSSHFASSPGRTLGPSQSPNSDANSAAAQARRAAEERAAKLQNAQAKGKLGQQLAEQKKKTRNDILKEESEEARRKREVDQATEARNFN
ncbi:hypothetical protein UCRPC4_g05327 [Phaeomoniella chlamydospora]|uniref:Uncharacterized protein n=1 Tax=Phaeomoniella chlamydospora TaxID=158046 RepID=A0A0G2E4P6_PHACM|nr:hypothetical protein UCRPC4_g05327 [Phaeomoniella chlamydospora]